MGKKITGAEFPLMKIFSSDFDYHIPSYQRPYAWTEEEAGTLFDDLYDFYRNESDDSYFLGSIVLIKEDDKPKAEVIDGQQRLTTLTILLATMAYNLTGEVRTNCINYLREPGNELEGLPPRPRLHLRERDQGFFEKYIQNLELEELIGLDIKTVGNEAQKHIVSNTKELLTRINKAFGENDTEMKKFCGFLVQRCYLVAVYTPTQASAFRVFSVMNSRGLDLLPIDIIKSKIIGQISEDKQNDYTNKWEELEVQTTRAGFNEVFTHTRMIFAKVKAKRTLLEEFQDYVIKNSTPEHLIDNVLEPYSEAYSILKNNSYTATKNVTEVNKYLLWLKKVNFSDWMPPAIRFFADNKNDPDYILWFVRRLERLTSYLHTTAKDINKRIERYARILTEMDSRSDHSIIAPLTTIELTEDEKKEFLMALDGDIYKMTARRRNYIILRLDSFVSDGAASYEPNILTIEHVLPQTVKPDSDWDKTWPDIDERTKWTHRIANLVPLTRHHNSQAQNYDFDVKKLSYFTGKNGTTSYSLTTQLINETVWSPDIVAKRQEKLLKVFREKWEL